MKKRIILLFFHSISIFSMDIPTSPRKNAEALCIKQIKVFNPDHMLKNNHVWKSYIPQRITITSNGGVVMSEKGGRITYIDFNILFQPEYPSVLIQHPNVESAPFLATAEQSNKSVLVVSAGNYIDKRTSKLLSECIVFCSLLKPNPNGKIHDDVFINKKIERLEFNFPIQGIGLDRKGELLAILESGSINIYDLNSKDSAKKRIFSARENILTNIALNPEGTFLTAIETKGMIHIEEVKKDDSEIDISGLKTIQCNDKVDKIYLLSSNNILYVTNTGDVKIISMNDWLENTNPYITTRILSEKESFDRAEIDQNLSHCIAYWTKKQNNHQSTTIKVYQEEETFFREIIISLPKLKDYDYLRSNLTQKTKQGSIMNVAFRGNYLVAIATDGIAYVYKLPTKQTIPNEHYVRSGNSIPFGRRRSATDPNSENPSSPIIPKYTSDETLHKYQKKLISLPKIDTIPENTSVNIYHETPSSIALSDMPTKAEKRTYRNSAKDKDKDKKK